MIEEFVAIEFSEGKYNCFPNWGWIYAGIITGFVLNSIFLVGNAEWNGNV